jgi:hypothetical protein
VWPRKTLSKPDPFEEQERDAIIVYFRQKIPLYYSFGGRGEAKQGQVAGISSKGVEWAHLDSNQGPTGYEPVALTN